MNNAREFTKKIFLESIEKMDSKGSFLSKKTIIEFARECNLDFKEKEAKTSIISKIIKSDNFEKLYDRYIENFNFPNWKVGQYYDLTSDNIESLRTLGVIKEEPIKEYFYSKEHKKDIEFNSYPISIFSYNKDYLKEQFELAFMNKGYKLRIETKEKDEIDNIIEALKNVMIVDNPDSYEHRNGSGYYHYLFIKLLNNSEIESNRLLLDIKSLKDKINKLEKDKNDLRYSKIQEIKEVNEKWADRLGVKNFLQAKKLVAERDYYKEQYEKLLEEVNKK